MKSTIAFFDFDGTITSKDSMIEFIVFTFGWFKFLFGLFVLLPSLIAYLLGLISNEKAKIIFLSFFFKEISSEKFIKLSKHFSLNGLDNIIRKSAIQRIRWHIDLGHEVVVVSASLESWLKPWCKKNNIKLIATKMILNHNEKGNIFSLKNCYGKEKVKRIKNEYDLKKYDKIYAYGDSDGDKEMLEISTEKFYKYFY